MSRIKNVEREMHITVCICTLNREALLRALLSELEQQETDGKFTYSVVVADNDVHQSAKAVVCEAESRGKVSVRYVVEPVKNIAMARNRAVAAAEGEFVAFIDDDELPPRDWLKTLLSVCQEYGADGVLAPVRPRFDELPPDWLVKGRFCERPEHPTGYQVGWRETRTGNVLINRSSLISEEGPFRPELGNGGEDQECFRRLIEKGCRFVWSADAAVYECVPPERWRRSYLLKRALLRGQNERHLTNAAGICRSLVAIPVYTAMLPVLCVLGHHHVVRYLVRLCDHVGRVLGVLGIHPLGRQYV